MVNVNQEKIFLDYIPSFNYKSKFSIRNERTPSCSTIIEDDVIYVKDFGSSDKSMDCINVIMKFENCSFGDAIKIINEKYCDLSEDQVKQNIERIRIIESESLNNVKIEIKEAKKFDEFELNWWKNNGISEKTLKKFKVSSSNKVSVSGIYNNKPFEKIIESFTDDPVFVYHFGTGNKKVYCPLRDKKNKWKSNTKAHDIQGFSQLPKWSYMLVITKSLKDVMAFHDLGISAVAPQSEGGTIPEDIMEELKERFTLIKIMYDNDDAGKQTAKNLSSKINVPYIQWSDDLPKDLTDTISSFGAEKAKELFFKHWNDV